MLVNLTLCAYNNYYNRIIKREETLADYAPFRVGIIPNVSFNPNDDIDTEQIINWPEENEAPDYLIVSEIGTGTILYRWFIIESQRLRNGQYRLTLHRDVVADYYEDILNAPSFIEKATITSNDPFIFNSENMTYNKIKSGETLLMQTHNLAWIVGYLSRDNTYQNVETTTIGRANDEYDSPQDYPYNRYINEDFFGDYTRLDFRINVSVFNSRPTPSAGDQIFEYGIHFGDISDLGYYYIDSKNQNQASKLFAKGVVDVLPDSSINKIVTQMQTAYENTPMRADSYAQTGASGTTSTNNFLSENGKIIKLGNAYYKVEIRQVGQRSYYTRVTANSALYVDMMVGVNALIAQDVISGNPSASDLNFAMEYQFPIYRLNLTPISVGTFVFPLSATRNHLNDAPYDMFVLPYPLGSDTFGQLDQTASLSISAAQKIAEKYISSGLYDLQLLPYCPLQTQIINGQFDISGLTEGSDFSYITQNGNNVGYIFWATSSTGEFDIEHEIEILDAKIENECDQYRLCSPNYNGAFEFSAAKNGGVRRFNVDFTYKPYTPYIHVNPDFGRLYGIDFNDSRGLICSGDFSLPACSNAWEQYEVNNKNYQNSFDRQIQNMELRNDVARIEQIAGAIVGTAQAGATASLIGPAGAIAGAAASAAGGLADYAIQEKLRNETIDYTKDQFGYTLGNIRGVPNTLAKVSAFNSNNKIFPFLEYYTCTEEEKEALRNKIKYNGMTIMRVGYIKDYIRTEQTYIKAKIIRIETISNDYHMLRSIAAELDKGVFI